MTDQDFMKIVINKGKQRLEKNISPNISIIVKANLIISEGHSSVGEYELSGHNDLNCINEAAKKLKTFDLSGCTMYSTVEPCSMCLACAAWAGLTRIVFGAYQEDIPQNKYEISDYHAIDHAKRLILPNNQKMEIAGGILQAECAELMKDVKDWILSK
ncbi:MAG: nucleoside deaminase [Candidatus Shapirobacteria bacterium]